MLGNYFLIKRSYKILFDFCWILINFEIGITDKCTTVKYLFRNNMTLGYNIKVHVFYISISFYVIRNIFIISL